MSALHTPGPWTLPHFAQPEVNCECGYVLQDRYLGAVCTVHCSGDGEDWASHGDNPKFAEACANARLIAAAPELLSALGRLRANFKLLLAQKPVRDVDETLGEVDAAIAKATGAQP